MDIFSYYKRFRTETLYLWDDETETFIKSVPQKGYFAKLLGGTEFPIDANSHIVIRAIHGKNEVSKEEYEAAKLFSD